MDLKKKSLSVAVVWVLPLELKLSGMEGEKLWTKTELSCLSALKACVLKKKQMLSDTTINKI